MEVPCKSDVKEMAVSRTKVQGPCKDLSPRGQSTFTIGFISQRTNDNKIDKLRSPISYQWDIKNCNILCFTKSWLNDNIKNIQLAGYTL